MKANCKVKTHFKVFKEEKPIKKNKNKQTETISEKKEEILTAFYCVICVLF